MKIIVLIEKDNNSTKNINFTGSSVHDLLRQLEINPETVLVTRNDEVITEDVSLKDNDKVEILSVISGG